MATSKSLAGNTVSIPSAGETGWGGNVGAILDDLIDIADAIGLIVSGVGIRRQKITNSTLAANATLTPATERHRVNGSGGAVTLHATTAIADGSIDGQMLVLEGTHATNTVTIIGGANTDQNGDVELGLSPFTRAIVFNWNAQRGLWIEESRTA